MVTHSLCKIGRATRLRPRVQSEVVEMSVICCHKVIVPGRSEAYIPTSMVRHDPMTVQIVFGLDFQPQSNSASRRPSTSAFSVCLNTCMKCRLQVQTYPRTGRAVIASVLETPRKPFFRCQLPCGSQSHHASFLRLLSSIARLPFVFSYCKSLDLMF